MLRYTLKRFSLLIPTLLVVSLLAFGLNKCTPGDPIAQRLPPSKEGVQSYKDYLNIYSRLAKEEGLDQPFFYFSIHTAAYPDTLHRILPLPDQANVRRLIAQFPNDWALTQAYFRQLRALRIQFNRTDLSYHSDALIETRRLLERLSVQYQPEEIATSLKALEEQVRQDTTLALLGGKEVNLLKENFTMLVAAPSSWDRYLPVFHWNGWKNQYHHWLRKVVSGDLGVSTITSQDVSEKISMALAWTLRLNLSAILIAYLLAIPLGVYAALKAGTGFERRLNIALFFLYALPSFWIATLLSHFFTNPEWLNLFPSMGVGEISPEASWLEGLGVRVHHFFLPVFCMVYGTLAYVTRQVRASMVKILQSDFIRTARAKGLSQRQVLWKHAFPNALFPLITMFGSLLPRAIAGAIIIEQIFNIPGVGLLTINSILSKDWPIVYALLLLTSILTIIGILLADLLYAWADPRVQLNQQNQEAHA